MAVLSCVCAKARPPEKHCTPGLIPALSILLCPFAVVQDRLLELAMEVLSRQLRVELVEQGSGLSGAALLAVSAQAAGRSCCLCCCPGELCLLFELCFQALHLFFLSNSL